MPGSGSVTFGKECQGRQRTAYALVESRYRDRPTSGREHDS